MAPSATATQSQSSKIKRPVPPGIQTNGINSSTSSPSPSMSAGRLPPAKNSSSSISNGVRSSTSGPRSATRIQRDPQVLGRGHRNTSAGLRSASLAGELGSMQTSEPLPYVQTDDYILKKHRGQKPSLIVHLYPTHFRFDQQEGSFTYKSPMRIVIEHLRQRTIPHDLVEFMDVPMYDGCMIVQIYDHKSITPSQDVNRPTTAAGKTVPFSVHNYNTFLTPSSYVPYPKQNPLPAKSSGPADGDQEGAKVKTAEQKDKENMPAPAIPGDGHRNKSSTQPRKPKISTIVLHPTLLSNHFEFLSKGIDSVAHNDGRRDSTIVPPTPSTAVPPTPMTVAPPIKRLKKGKAELDVANIYAAQSQIILGTTAPLVLDPVNSATESAALLKALAHPKHLEKPPSPKSRKRTIAEMAADEALAADQERYMLILDERLSSTVTGAAGANPVDSDGQAGSSSFEPRFERFKVLENIKSSHEEKARLEKLRTEEAERKAQQDRERDRLRVEAEKREQEKNRTSMAAQQQAQAAHAVHQRTQQEAHRRHMVAAAAQAQGLSGMPAQVQVQHAHPQTNGMMANGMQGQPQRFHQQVSQAQVSSPIVRNGTPQTHSSPMNSMGNVPMQHSTSSMGGSPARPGSVVHQNHPTMNAATPHAMTAQRSQQSHAGTPRMPNSTPNIQNAPLNRQISQTPRMTQGSPLPGQMAQAPQMQMMQNGQPLTQQQQYILNQQRMQQAMRQNPQMMNAAGQVNPQAAAAMQHRLAQQQAMQMNNSVNGGYNPQMAAVMAARGGNMMNANFMNGQNMQQPMNAAQQQQIQQQMMQNQQLAARAVVQSQAQQAAQMQSLQIQAQQVFTNQVLRTTQAIYLKELPSFQARYPGGIPDEVDRQLRQHCQQQANLQVRAMRQRAQQQQQAQAQQQLMAAQQSMNGMPNGMQNGMPNGMQNGMGM